MGRKGVAALAIFLGALAALPAGAQVFPAYLNYQGKLGDASGNPLTGTYSFEFKLYNAGTGGTQLFDDANYTGGSAVSVVNGVYSVQIGSLTAGGIPPAVFFNSEVWLEVHVNAGATLAGAETLSPRERLTTSPFAFLASNAEYLGAGVAIATFTTAGNLLVPGGVSGSSGSFVNGVTASSGTFLATGAGQYALSLSTSITFVQGAGNGLGIRWGDGTISTTAAGGSGGLPAGTAGGNLAGTYPNPIIGSQVILATHIANGVITTSQLSAAAGITGSQIAATTLTNGNMAAGTFGNVSIPAANVNAGALGGSVIASSVAVSGVAPGTYGNGTQVAQVAVGIDGRVTSASNLTITGAAPTGTAGGNLAGTYPNPIIGSQVILATHIANGVITNSQIAAGTFGNITLPAANIAAGTAGINISGNAATVTTDANLTGNVTSVGNATTIASLPAISGAALTSLTGANVSGNIPGNAASITGSVLANQVTAGSFQNGAYTFPNAVNFPGSGQMSAAGSLGVGITPTQKLEVNGTTKFDAVTIGGDANVKVFHDVAEYFNNSAGVVGAIVIQTPIPMTANIMARIHLEGYTYDANSPLDMTIGGYFYNVGPAFYNYGVINAGASKPSVTLAVNGSGNAAIILGGIATVWQYPHINVTDVLETYSTPSDAHATGWSTSLVTSLAAYTVQTAVPDVTTIPGSGVTGNIGGTASNVTGVVAVANGGTGASSQAGAQANLNVPATDGTGASGTWGINITGNAGGAPPTGTAGGVLSGTYPNPAFNASGNAVYPVAAGNGNGINFWNSASYAITMGNGSLYDYAPNGGVSDYSIKTTMDATAGRGFTWGVVGVAPTASLTTGGLMSLTSGLNAGGEIVGTLASGSGQFRAVDGSYGAMIRNDGANTYWLLTASGSPYGGWNSLRPWTMNDATGDISMGSNVNVGGNLTTTGSTLFGTGGSYMVNASGVATLANNPENAVTFANSWINYGSGYQNASYWRDAFHIVHLKGLITNGGCAGTTIFTLPSGYQPPAQELHIVPSSSTGGNARVDVDTSGNVICQGFSGTGGSWLSLDGFTFKTNQP
jgi:hypothetical protein